MERATSADVVKSGQLAGTLEDRRNLALQEADECFAAASSVLSNVDVGGEITVDRLVQTPSAAPIALIALTAADRVAEAALAKRVIATVSKLADKWPGVHTVIVSIGYSTEKIREQLRYAAAVIEYEESSFSQRVQGVIADSLKNKESAPALSENVSPEEFRKLATSIEEKLASIEARRAEEMRKMFESFAANARASAAPEKQKRELKTRWDILGELDLLTDSAPEDLRIRRETMRAVLVANETNLKNSRIDFLGSIYLDCLTSVFDKPTKQLQSEILLKIRRVLNPAVLEKLLNDRPWQVFGTLIGSLITIIVFVLQFSPSIFEYRYERTNALWICSAFLAMAICSLLYVVIFEPSAFRSSWRRRFERATRDVRERQS